MMDQCNCNQGRLPCTCDGWPRTDHKHDHVLLVATLAILIITGAYAYVRNLIGLEVL